VILGSTAEGEEKLDLGFLVAVAPVKVGIRVGSVVRSRGSAINHIPESSVLKNQGNHLAPVCIVVPIIVEEQDLVLDVLKLWLSGWDRGGGRHLGSGCGVLGSSCGSVLWCSIR